MRALLLCLPLLVSPVARADEVRDLLERWAEKTKDVRALRLEVTQTKKAKLLRRPLVSKGVLIFQLTDGAARMRLDLKGEGDALEMVLQLVPGEVRIWHPRLKRQEVYPVREGTPPPDSPFLVFGDDVRKLPERYDVRLERTDGRDALVLTPRVESQVAWMRLEFKDGELVATEQADRRGGSLRSEIARWEANPTLDPKAFELDVPPDTEVVKMGVK